jgi:DNA-binding response OmpR family regulator
MEEKSPKQNRILVIEDDHDLQDVYRDILSNAGYGALCAFDGESGLDMAENEKPDLILLDLGFLPGAMKGIDVCRELARREETRGIPVIIVTVSNELPTKLSAFMAGARRYVTKPFEVENLLAEISRTFRQSKVWEA